VCLCYRCLYLATAKLSESHTFYMCKVPYTSVRFRIFQTRIFVPAFSVPCMVLTYWGVRSEFDTNSFNVGNCSYRSPGDGKQPKFNWTVRSPTNSWAMYMYMQRKRKVVKRGPLVSATASPCVNIKRVADLKVLDILSYNHYKTLCSSHYCTVPSLGIPTTSLKSAWHVSRRLFSPASIVKCTLV